MGKQPRSMHQGVPTAPLGNPQRTISALLHPSGECDGRGRTHAVHPHPDAEPSEFHSWLLLKTPPSSSRGVRLVLCGTDRKVHGDDAGFMTAGLVIDGGSTAH